MKRLRLTLSVVVALIVIGAGAYVWRATSWRRAKVEFESCHPSPAPGYWTAELTGDAVPLEEKNGRFHWQTRRGCHWTDAAVVHQPLQRLVGYEQAVERWMNDYDRFGSRLRLRRVLGRSFESREELARWWMVNRDYLTAADHRLIVDEAAKQAKRPTYDHDPEVEITAEDYWDGIAWGVVRVQSSDPEWLRGRIFRGQDLDSRFRIKRALLADAEAKRRGYIAAGDRFIAWLRLSTDAATNAPLLEQMTRLTGRTFADRGQAIRWWSENRDRLELDQHAQLTPRNADSLKDRS